VLDGETSIEFLPSIQWATRQTVNTFSKAVGDDFGSTIDQFLTRVDQANQWEMKYGRLTHLSKKPFPPLSERSVAHLLGPLAVLHVGNQLSYSKEVERVGEAYLALRQHLDDAHDWLEDHQRGIRTAVGDVVRKAGSTQEIPELRKAYSQQGVRFVCTKGKKLLKQCKQAREGLPPAWQGFLQSEEQRLQASLTTFEDAVRFSRSLTTSSAYPTPSKGRGRDQQGLP
jgi:hypothetical protein